MGVNVEGERRSGFDEYIVGTPVLNWKLILEWLDGRQGSSRPINLAKGKAQIIAENIRKKEADKFIGYFCHHYFKYDEKMNK